MDFFNYGASEAYDFSKRSRSRSPRKPSPQNYHRHPESDGLITYLREYKSTNSSITPAKMVEEGAKHWFKLPSSVKREFIERSRCEPCDGCRKKKKKKKCDDDDDGDDEEKEKPCKKGKKKSGNTGGDGRQDTCVRADNSEVVVVNFHQHD